MVGLLKEKCPIKGSALVSIADRLDIQRQEKPEFQEFTLWLSHWNLTYAPNCIFPTTDTSNNIGFSRSYWQRLFFSRSHSKLAALLSLCVSHSNEPSCRKYCFLKPRRVLCFRLCGRGYKTQQFVLYFGELSPYTPDHWTSKNVTEMAGSWIPVGFYSHHLEHTSMSSIKWISAMSCGMPSHSRSQLYYDWTGKLT